MRANFEGLGWIVRLQKKGENYFLTLIRELVIGNALRKGMPLYYFLVTVDGRKAVLLFLDGKERPDAEIVKIKSNTFLISNNYFKKLEGV